MMKKEYTGTNLLEDIVNFIKEQVTQWPEQNDNLISKEKWIEGMSISPKFYWWHRSQNATEIDDYEKLLLDLAAKFLQIKITIIPFIEEEDEIVLTFEPSNPNYVGEYYILRFCDQFRNDNFFLSISKN